jgi:5-methylcytosine-specific restriction endonuclease McrA
MRPFDSRDKRTGEASSTGVCARCGECLDDEWEEAHHVVPNQSGDPDDASHSWLRSPDNCVVLCYLCHVMERSPRPATFRTLMDTIKSNTKSGRAVST